MKWRMEWRSGGTENMKTSRMSSIDIEAMEIINNINLIHQGNWTKEIELKAIKDINSVGFFLIEHIVNKERRKMWRFWLLIFRLER